jgi:hypothetical protein
MLAEHLATDGYDPVLQAILALEDAQVAPRRDA